MCKDCKNNVNKLDENKLKELENFINNEIECSTDQSNLIAVLHKAQELFGYLDRIVMDKIAIMMKIPTAHIWGVATFYHYFNLKPIGKYVISMCMGTACYVKGANKVLDKLKKILKIEVGETTEDGLFTLQEARCLGACGLAPVLMINDKIHGDLTEDNIEDLINEYKEMANQD